MFFAIWLRIWSKQTPRKSTNISSTTGRSPACAAPTARPTNAVSEIGVSRTRSGAELLLQPARGAEDAAEPADVLAEHEHARVALHLVAQRLGDQTPMCCGR